MGEKRKRTKREGRRAAPVHEGRSKATPQECYEVYLNLGSRRSLRLVWQKLQDTGRYASMPNLKRWCAEQKWEDKAIFAAGLGAQTLRTIVRDLTEMPVLGDLSRATLTLEDINAFLSVLAVRLQDAVKTVRIETVDEVRTLAELLPVILNISAQVRGDLLALIPSTMAASGGGRDIVDAEEIMETEATEVKAEDEPKANLPVPVPAPSAIQAAIVNFRKYQRSGAA